MLDVEFVISTSSALSDEHKGKFMLHKLVIIAITAFLLMQFSPLWAQKSYQAVVSEKEAVFTFPVNSQQQYEWCPGGLQYAWNVKAQNGKDSFEFGFSLFTAMGASLCGKGDFTTLLNEGQFSIWKINKDSISIVPYLKVKHVVSSDRQFLNVMLKDQEAIKLIFSKKPKYIIFQS
ncbi:MAG: hypothetical protein WCH01_22040 [Methylococcaceae bacterium]